MPVRLPGGPPASTSSTAPAAPPATRGTADHVYALTLEYDGGAFSGWQRQPGRRTVEGVLRDALAAVTGEPLALTAAGRTDAGAHAHGQVVGCTLDRDWDGQRLRAALNANLPTDVTVVAAAPAAPNFHARLDALARTYRYVVTPRAAARPVVARQYAWWVPEPLDVAAMRRAAACLVGTHDLAAFGRSPRAGGTTVRSVHAVEVISAEMPEPDAAGMPSATRPTAKPPAASPGGLGTPPGETPRQAVFIDVTADAFLYGMMRAIAAALVAVGTGRLAEAELRQLVEQPGSRPRLGGAPSHGLHQWSVRYAAADMSLTPGVRAVGGRAPSPISAPPQRRGPRR